MRKGFDSYASRIANIKDEDFREGLLHIYEGIKRYAERYVDYLEEKNAEKKLINALKKFPWAKPTTFMKRLFR